MVVLLQQLCNLSVANGVIALAKLALVTLGAVVANDSWCKAGDAVVVVIDS